MDFFSTDYSKKLFGIKSYGLLLFLFLMVLESNAQTTYDWLNTAPDNNWKQGASGARWNPGRLFDEPQFGILRFNNNHQLRMNNNVSGTYSTHGLIFGSFNTTTRTLGGNPIGLFDFSGNDPFIRNESSALHVIDLNIDVDPNDPIDIQINNSGGLTFNGIINNQGSFIDVIGSTSSSVDVTFNGVISGSGGFFKSNANTNVSFTASNTYTGNTIIQAGSLILGASNVISNSSDIVLDGGALSSGTTTGNAEKIGTLDLDASSSIDLGSGSHALTFANSSGVTWSAGAVLTINNWSGAAGTSGSGSAGTINVGSGGLTSGQLDQIQFAGYPQGAVLNGGEVVPEFEKIPTNASNLSFTNVEATSMDISWTNGNGTDRIVVLRESSAVNFTPVNGNSYTANSDFSAGTGLGASSDNKVVFNGSGNSVTVTGLSLGTTYHVAIYEYNGSSGTESYATGSNLTGSQTTSDIYKTVTSATTVDYSNTASWEVGVVPPVGAKIEIQTDVTLDQDATVSEVTINSGSTLTSESGQSRTLTIEDGGSFTNNGTFTANDGTVSFSGAATVSGTVVFNNVDYAGGLDYGTGSTVNGIATVNPGGFVNTNAPTYGSSSTLVYNINGNYGRNAEWTPGATSGTGYPNNVQLSNSTVLELGANGSTGSAFQCAGDFTVDANSTLTLDNPSMNQALTVIGNFTNDGTVTLSTATGGDLKLQGDFDDNGTFNANGRAVFFEGGATQNINSTTDPLKIDVLRINKTGGEVVMDQNLLASETPDPIQLNSANSVLNLNGHNLAIGNDGVTSSITMASGSAIKGGSGSGLIIEGDGDLGTIRLDQSTLGTSNLLSTLTVSRAAGGGLSIAGDLAIEASGTATIEADNFLSTDGTITNNGTITIEDNASLVQTATGNNSTGTYNVTQNAGTVDNIAVYQHWSSPLVSETMGGAFPNSNTNDFYTWDESVSGSGSNSWVSVASNTVMTPGKGYATTPDQTGPATSVVSSATFSGQDINNGDVNLSLNSPDNDDYLLVGNPYPSAIDNDKFFTDNPSLTGTIWYWDQTIETYSGGTWNYSSDQDEYATWTSAGGVSGNGGTQPSDFTQSMQGFFVQIDQAKTTPGQVSFKNGQRVTGNNAQFFKKPTQETRERVWVDATNDSGAFNQILVALTPQTTAQYDKGWDGEKLKGNPHIAFFSILGQKDLAIQALDQDLKDDKVIPLGLDAGQTGQYTIALDSLDNWPGHSIALLDKDQDMIIDLQHNDYRFAVNQTGAIRGRFYLLISGAPFVGIEEEARSGELLYFQRGASLIVDSRLQNSPLEAVTLRSVSGRTVRQATPGTLRHELSVSDLPRGVYLLETQNRAGETGHHKVYLR